MDELDGDYLPEDNVYIDAPREIQRYYEEKYFSEQAIDF